MPGSASRRTLRSSSPSCLTQLTRSCSNSEPCMALKVSTVSKVCVSKLHLIIEKGLILAAKGSKVSIYSVEQACLGMSNIGETSVCHRQKQGMMLQSWLQASPIGRTMGSLVLQKQEANKDVLGQQSLNRTDHITLSINLPLTAQVRLL